MTWQRRGGSGEGCTPRWKSKQKRDQRECRLSSARAQGSRKGKDKQGPHHEAIVKNPGKTPKCPGVRPVFLKADPGGTLMRKRRMADGQRRWRL